MRGALVAGWVGVLLALELSPRLARACSLSPTPPAQIDPSWTAFDSEPPVLADVRLAEIERGVYNGCVFQSSIALSADAWDNRTPADALGYRIELLRGEGPAPYAEPMAYPHLLWADDGSEPLDVELRVRAVDAAGNESNPIDIRVSDAENFPSEGGCSVARAGGAASARRAAMSACLSVLAAAAWRLQRRRR